MGRKIKWPNGHDFAFTIVDDTDGATVQNVKPVYDYLYQKGILTTKTCWAYPSKDTVYTGQSLQDADYRDFLLELKERGFELGFHNAASGGCFREETLAAFEDFRSTFGEYPHLHINHSNNNENIYWGAYRFSGPVRKIYGLLRKSVRSYGHEKDSNYFWGDLCKAHVKYIRNRTFNGINTLREDHRLVYRETGKDAYSNYWFSSSDGMRLRPFLNILTKKNVDNLVRQRGCCILYTHFAYEFVDQQGNLSGEFKQAIDYLATKNGWFVPAGELLDYVLENKEYKPSKLYELWMDIKWLIERVIKK